MAVDTEGGFAQASVTKPANESETKQLKRLVHQLPTSIDGTLAEKGLARKRTQVPEAAQAPRSDPAQRPSSQATEALAVLNRISGTLRYKVERAFGTLKRQFHRGRTSYFGTKKVQAYSPEGIPLAEFNPYVFHVSSYHARHHESQTSVLSRKGQIQ